MRYKKGEFSFTPQDGRLLSTIARARFITRRQLTAITYPETPEAYHADKVRWRLTRLLKANLVIETRVLPEESVLTVTGRGLAFLKVLDRAFEEQVDGLTIRPPNPRSPLRRHETAVNEIWLAFQQSGQLVRWVTAFDLYVTARKRARASLKYYDALAELQTTKGAYRIGIEYERLLKRNRNYGRVLSAIRSDVHIPLVLYVCATDPLKWNLIHKFVNLPKVFFVNERAILASPMSAIVEQYTQDLLPVTEKLSHVLAALPAARAEVDF
jgi:hypothetical protein